MPSLVETHSVRAHTRTSRQFTAVQGPNFGNLIHVNSLKVGTSSKVKHISATSQPYVNSLIRAAILGGRNSPTVFLVGPTDPEVHLASPVPNATALQTRLILPGFLALYSRRRRTLLLFVRARLQVPFAALCSSHSDSASPRSVS